MRSARCLKRVPSNFVVCILMSMIVFQIITCSIETWIKSTFSMLLLLLPVIEINVLDALLWSVVINISASRKLFLCDWYLVFYQIRESLRSSDLNIWALSNLILTIEKIFKCVQMFGIEFMFSILVNQTLFILQMN